MNLSWQPVLRHFQEKSWHMLILLFPPEAVLRAAIIQAVPTMISPKTPKLVRTMAVPSTDSHPSMAKTANPTAPKGTGNIKSPLPGVILEMYVREGDTVKIGQKLLMLEAMKMENVINADKEGRVTLIKVSKGDSVMEGDILIVIGE